MFHGLGNIKTFSLTLTAAAAISILAPDPVDAAPKNNNPGVALVKCGLGESIQAVLDSDLTDIMIRGVCDEHVIINKSNITIAGESPGDGINYTGPETTALSVLDSQNIVLDQLTITAPVRPLSIRIGSTATISNSVLTGPATGRAALFVGDNSVANVESTTVIGGIRGNRHATLRILSSIVTGSGDSFNSPLSLVGSIARVWETDFTGELSIGQNSRIAFGAFPRPPVASTIDATGHPGAILCFGQSLVEKGPGISGNVTVINSARDLSVSNIEFGSIRPVNCTLTNLGNPVVICPESIQARIDEGIENRVIEVDGDCEQNVVVDVNGVTINGGDIATITGDGLTPAITITANEVAIEHWAEIDGGLEDGIVVHAGGSAVVRDINLITGEDGVVVTEAAFVEINHSNVFEADDQGIVASQSGGAKIIDTTTTFNTNDGVLAVSGGSVNIAGGNTINNNGRFGLFAAGSQYEIRGANTIQDNAEFDIRCAAYSRVIVIDSITSTTQEDSTTSCVLFGLNGIPIFVPIIP